jgi:hypothetical protein
MRGVFFCTLGKPLLPSMRIDVQNSRVPTVEAILGVHEVAGFPPQLSLSVVVMVIGGLSQVHMSQQHSYAMVWPSSIAAYQQHM